METFECVAVYTVRFLQLHLQVTELRIQKVKPVTETLNRLDPVNGNV